MFFILEFLMFIAGVAAIRAGRLDFFGQHRVLHRTPAYLAAVVLKAPMAVFLLLDRFVEFVEDNPSFLGWLNLQFLHTIQSAEVVTIVGCLLIAYSMARIWCKPEQPYNPDAIGLGLSTISINS